MLSRFNLPQAFVSKTDAGLHLKNTYSDDSSQKIAQKQNTNPIPPHAKHKTHHLSPPDHESDQPKRRSVGKLTLLYV
jgi:hypothetical protein